MSATSKFSNEIEIELAHCKMQDARSKRDWSDAMKPRRTIIPNKEGGLDVVEFKPDFEHKVTVTDVGGSTRSTKKRKASRDKTQFSEVEKALKHIDVIAFNTKAEEFFIIWLADKISCTIDGCVSLGWLWSNAAYELDVSIETAKRYLAKHTADRAEFVSMGGKVYLRE